MAKTDPFVNFVLDQLRELDGLTCRRMFGGYGLYRGDDQVRTGEREQDG